jgi:dihydrofolate reductase
MRKLFSSVNISLDGFADHTIGNPDAELLDFFTAQFDRIGTVLFGRVTYQLFEAYWPHADEDPAATPSMLAYARKINAIPKVVFSRTLEKADWNNASLVKRDPLVEVAKLKQGTGKDLLVGGLSLLQAFTRARLMDEYWLLVHPLVVGKGRPYFDGLQGRLDLRLAGTRTFRSGVVVLHYILGRQNAQK